MPLPAGTRLGAYLIDAPIGAGGMGEVYKARDTRLDRIVAIKVLPDGANGDPDRRERFRREARVISSLNDAHICTLFDIGEENGTSYLVMEYLAGETLAERLVCGPLPVSSVLGIGAEIARALESAHRSGIVHRDLKPANVMLTDAGAKILDFGIAKWRELPEIGVTHTSATPFLSSLTQAGAVIGTVHYMAPEQVEGRPIDARADVFALGAMMYEMTTGRKAFEGTSPTAVMAAILTATPPSLVSMQPDIPNVFDRLVRKCLEKDPARRWQTAADLRDELEWIAQQPDDRPSRPESVPARVQLKRWIPAGVIAVAIGVLLGWALLKPASPTTDVTSFEIFPPVSGTSAQHPTISPDGRKLVFIAPTSNGQSALWARRFDTLEPRMLAEADELAFPFWSPDSQSVAFFAQGRLQRVSANGGVVQSVCVALAGRGGTWGRDGTIVLAASSDGGLSRVPAAGGTPAAVTTLDASERSHYFPQFLTDSRHVIYSVYFTNNTRPPVLKVTSIDAPDSARVLTESSRQKGIVAAGHLLFTRELSGPYVAQRLDERRLELSGEPFPVVDRVVLGPIDGAAAISVSSNGVLAYQTIANDRLARLVWFARDGRRLGSIGDPQTTRQAFDFKAFSLSVDGTHVATVAQDPKTRLRDVWVIDAASDTASRVTTSGNASFAGWGPDSNQIIWRAREPDGHIDIRLATWNGRWSEEPLFTSDRNTYSHDWSRDGQFVLFSMDQENNQSSTLSVLRIGPPVSVQQYLTGPGAKTNARFSPDGHWVAYESDETGRPEVRVQSFPDPHRQYTISTAGGMRPRWRRDGRELFYLAPDGGVMAVPVTLTPDLKIGVARKLFSLPVSGAARPPYDVAPDGNRFLVAEVIREESYSPITVVTNWMASLRH